MSGPTSGEQSLLCQHTTKGSAMNDLFLLEPEYRYHAERAREASSRPRPPLAPPQRGAPRFPTRRTGSAEVTSVVHDIMDPMTSELVGRDAELEH
jgi:hypothetical protein